MPRIRNLKPQFWDSPDTARADLACRLLYMAMWNWADDAGRGTANLKELEAFAFPNDDIQTLPRRASAAGSSTKLAHSANTSRNTSTRTPPCPARPTVKNGTWPANTASTRPPATTQCPRKGHTVPEIRRLAAGICR